jgi:hypothetical protein
MIDGENIILTLGVYTVFSLHNFPTGILYTITSAADNNQKAHLRIFRVLNLMKVICMRSVQF